MTIDEEQIEPEKTKEEITQAKREKYMEEVLGKPGASLIEENDTKQKTTFLKELERLANLTAKESISAAVTKDCNTLLDSANTLINATTLDKCAIIGKFDKVKQRLMRAYDSRESHQWFFTLIATWNILWLATFVVFIIIFKLIPGQSNLDDTVFVCLACALWGGVGGIADAFFAVQKHMANQDFDRHYWPWYYGHPILGLSLGAVVYLVLQAGLLAIGGSGLQDSANTTLYVVADNITNTYNKAVETGGIGATALPIALAFLAGFRQRTMVNFLTRIMTAIFQRGGNDNAE